MAFGKLRFGIWYPITFVYIICCLLYTSIVGIELAVPMPEERTDTHAGFQHIAAHTADMLQGAIHKMCIRDSL